MTATDKARELGTEHGTTAAEEWLEAHPSRLRTIQRVGPSAFDDVPRPPQDFHAQEWYGSAPLTDVRAYLDAFTAAVGATVRARCSEVGP